MINILILIVSILSLIVLSVLSVMFYKLRLKREELDHTEDPEIIYTD
jgi:hypothetical protein